jgi:hypothetical protein
VAETPNDVLGDTEGGINPWQFLLKPLNRLFGFGKDNLPARIAGESSGAFYARIARSPTGIFSSAAVDARRGAPSPIPSANEPYRGPLFPSSAASVEPSRGSGTSKGKTKKKKLKKTIAQRIKDQLMREAMYYAEHPTELLRVLPPGRGMGGRMGRSGRPYRAAMERAPPSYQRGAIAAQGIGPRPGAARARRARLDPRAGRIGTQRPRSGPKPLEPIKPPQVARSRAPTAPLGTDSNPGKLPKGYLKPSQVVPGLPSQEDPRVYAEPNSPKPISAPGRQPGSAPARSGQPRRGTVLPSPYGMPRTGRAASRLPFRILSNLPSAIVEAGLRAVTRRTPSVRAAGSAAARAISLPIGDFPTSSPAPVARNAPIFGFAQGVSPFPVPKEALDKCRCDRKKKRETKKRQPRTVCRAGSYTQTAKGIKYHPNREVPCS